LAEIPVPAPPPMIGFLLATLARKRFKISVRVVFIVSLMIRKVLIPEMPGWLAR